MNAMLVGQSLIAFVGTFSVLVVVGGLLLYKYKWYLMKAYYGSDESLDGQHSVSEVSCQCDDDDEAAVSTVSQSFAVDRDLEAQIPTTNTILEEEEEDAEMPEAISVVSRISEWDPEYDEDDWTSNSMRGDGILGIASVHFDVPAVESGEINTIDQREPEANTDSSDENAGDSEIPADDSSIKSIPLVVEDEVAAEQNPYGCSMKVWLGRSLCAANC